MYREAGVHSFPEHYGNTCRAGREWERLKADEERGRWEKKPPAKRPQFSALGTTNPWIPDWEKVLAPAGNDEEESLNGEPLVRPWSLSGPALRYIDALLSGKSEPEETLLRVINAFREQRNMSTIPSSSTDGLYSSALVHVRLELECRGSPGDMAIIYSLSPDERERWLDAKEDDSKYGRAAWDLDEPKREMQRVGLMLP